MLFFLLVDDASVVLSEGCCRVSINAPISSSNAGSSFKRGDKELRLISSNVLASMQRTVADLGSPV